MFFYPSLKANNYLSFRICCKCYGHNISKKKIVWKLLNMYHYFFNLKDLIKWLIVSHCSRDCVVLCVVWLALHYPLKLSTLSSEDLCDLRVKTPLFNCKMSSTPPHIAYLQAVLRRGSRFKSSHHYHFLFFFFRKTFTQKLWEQMIQGHSKAMSLVQGWSKAHNMC